MEKETRLLPSLALSLTLITVFMLSINPVWSSGKTFVKCWKGNTQNVTGIVVTNLNTSQVLYAGSVPANGNITIGNLDHDTLLKVTWTDWKGAHTETKKVECVPGVPEVLVNDIPFPKLD